MKDAIFILFLAGLVSITGCATKPPTFGDRVLAERESRIEIAAQWEQGKLVLKSTKPIQNSLFPLVTKGVSHEWRLLNE